MLIHERFVFLHFQKTAGTFVADALRRELPQGSLRRGAPEQRHPGWGDIPSEAKDRPVLLFVRNPWDWYVSWYHFVSGRRPDNIIFRLLFSHGGGDFEETIRNACQARPGAAADPELRRLASMGNRLAECFVDGHDFYTASFLAFAGDGLDSDRLTIGRFESLFDDLERFLANAGVPLAAGAAARLRSGPPLKATPHLPYREYYDQDLRELVMDSCQMLIDRFGYRFEEGRPAAP